MNRTGIATSPIDSRRTIEGAEQAQTDSVVDGEALAAERLLWASSAPPIGTMPPPATLKGVIKTAVEKLEGHKPTVFLDKLGERLAFERTGTRLYEAVMVKLEAADPHPSGPSRADLAEIHAAERRHFTVVRDAILQLGADPTAMTPCADLISVAGFGWVQAVSDPRTTLNQCLDVLMIAELADTEGWQLLVELADQLGFDDLGRRFRAAMVEEERHVQRVRSWISASLIGEAATGSSHKRDDDVDPAMQPRH
jgi:rubrerythrin